VQRDSLFVNASDFPSIVEDDQGILFAHWLQKRGSDSHAYDAWISTSSDGGKTWRSPFLLNRDSTDNEHGFVSLAPRPGGGVAAAWLDGRNMTAGREEGEMSLRYAVVGADGSIRSDVQLDGRVCECCATGMAMSPAGPVIVYRDRSGDEVRDIAFVRAKGKGWSAPALVHADGWRIQGCPVNGPQIAANGQSVVTAWFTGAKNEPRVYTAFSSNGGATFGGALPVDDGKPLGRVDVAMFDEQTAVVTWVEQTASGVEIRARLSNSRNSRGLEVTVAHSAIARSAGVPRIAVFGREVYVAYTDPTGSAKRVRVARIRF
jgi:hypothetical protein